MSKSIANKVIHFAFSPTPSVNPYRTTANYINTFLQTKKFYDIGFNRRDLRNLSSFASLIFTVGMIQLDRANHCALCYFCYGLSIHIICGDLMVSGHLDQAWPNFLLGIKCTITIACACVILWLCVSHFALTNQRQNESHESSSGPLRSYIMARVLNLTMAYIRVKNIVTPIINVLLNSASTYSVHTYRPENLVAQILPSLKALHYICSSLTMGLRVMWSSLPSSAYIYQRKELREAQELRKKQKDVLVNSILELTIMILFIACNCYGLGIFHDGDFIFDLRFWIAIRLGTNGVIAIFGNM
ncbi:hypothetical protein DFH28DRAFT_930912 [Melampsora americana]|nr:hypothetical protein DFH28DRAFT_930912 [Melampsora americana]